MNRIEFENFIDDVKRVSESVPSIVENEDNSVEIITWLTKMLKRFEDNFNKLEELKNGRED